jgi:hypothetical protein
MVAREHQLLTGLVEAEVAGRVPRGPDGLQVPPRYLGPLPVLEQQVRDDGVDQRADRHGRRAQRLQLLRALPMRRNAVPPDRAGRRVVAVVNELGIGGERNPAPEALASGRPGRRVGVDMVTMTPRRGRWRNPPLHAARQCAESVVGVPAGVDQIRAAVGLEEVDEHVAQRVVGQRYRDAPQPWSDLRRRERGRWSPRTAAAARAGA